MHNLENAIAQHAYEVYAVSLWGSPEVAWQNELMWELLGEEKRAAWLKMAEHLVGMPQPSTTSFRQWVSQNYQIEQALRCYDDMVELSDWLHAHGYHGERHARTIDVVIALLEHPPMVLQASKPVIEPGVYY